MGENLGAWLLLGKLQQVGGPKEQGETIKTFSFLLGLGEGNDP